MVEIHGNHNAENNIIVVNFKVKVRKANSFS